MGTARNSRPGRNQILLLQFQREKEFELITPRKKEERRRRSTVPFARLLNFASHRLVLELAHLSYSAEPALKYGYPNRHT